MFGERKAVPNVELNLSLIISHVSATITITIKLFQNTVFYGAIVVTVEVHTDVLVTRMYPAGMMFTVPFTRVV
jgi:hypothetical protein